MDNNHKIGDFVIFTPEGEEHTLYARILAISDTQYAVSAGRHHAEHVYWVEKDKVTKP